MNNYIQMTNKDEVKQWIQNVLSSYIKKNHEDQTEIEHIIDYLNSDKAPTRLRKMSYAQAKINAVKWSESLIKKAANIVETDQDVKIVKDYKDGFKFVRLLGKAAFDREGNLMRHCVSSYHGKENVKIYSLRDSKNEPHCTIEIVQNDDLSINQIKGKGNGEIHPNYIKYVLDFLRVAKMSVRDSEMNNLGYFNPYSIDQELNKFLNDNFTNLRYIMYNNVKYYYKKDLM